MEFFSYEYQSGLSFPSPGGLPNPGTEPMSSAVAGGFFITESPRKPSLALPPQLPHHSGHTWGWETVLQLKSRARGEHGASTCTVLLWHFLVLVWASPLSGEMEKENTSLPHHMGEASAKTSQSLVNNTTNQDRNPSLSNFKKIRELNGS